MQLPAAARERQAQKLQHWPPMLLLQLRLMLIREEKDKQRKRLPAPVAPA